MAPDVADAVDIRTWWPWAAALSSGAVGLRILAFLAEKPLYLSDSLGYIAFGKDLLRFDLAGDTGQRTPVYPLFMALFGYQDRWIVLAQMLLGLVVTALLFFTALNLTRRAPLAFLAGIAYGWSPNQVAAENTLLTEALSVFLMVAAVALYAKAAQERRAGPWPWLALGSVAALGALARPLLLVLPVILVLAVWAGGHGRRAVALVALAGLGPILAWSLFNYARLGYFGVSTITGGSLTNHTGAYIEDASDRYDVIKRIYIADRDSHLGRNINVIWRTWPEMSKETGEAFPQLSQTLTRMSVELIATHPARYALGVARNLYRFWLGTPWMYEHPSGGTEVAVLSSANRAWRAVFVIVCTIALPLAGVVLFRSIRERDKGPAVQVLGVVLSVLLAGALAASAIDNDDVPRYGLPFLSVVGLLLALSIGGRSGGGAPDAEPHSRISGT